MASPPSLLHGPYLSSRTPALQGWGWERALVHSFKPSHLSTAFLTLWVFSQSSSEWVSAFHSFISLIHSPAIPFIF